jgi:cytochrome c-type biogenesis protein CcmH/NrfG
MAYAIYRAFKSSSESRESAIIKAKELLRHTISTDSKCSAAYVLLGRIYFEEGKKLLAEEQVESALRVDPENFEALSLYRRLYTRQQGRSRAQYLQKEVAKIESLREKFISAYEKMREQNYFELLDVPKGSPPERVKNAYQKAIESYSYEEIYDKCPSDMRAVLESIVNLLNKAYTVLSDTKAQESYVGLLDERAIEERFDVDHLEDPRKIFDRAQVMMKEGLYDSAVKALKKARDLRPMESIYHIWLGYAMFRAMPDDPRVRDTAKEMIDGALDINEDNADAYWMMGKIFAHEGDEETAVNLYRKATLVDPKHNKANIELSIRQKRRMEAIESQPSSLLDSIKGFFKGKKKKKK